MAVIEQFFSNSIIYINIAKLYLLFIKFIGLFEQGQLLLNRGLTNWLGLTVMNG